MICEIFTIITRVEGETAVEPLSYVGREYFLCQRIATRRRLEPAVA